MATYTWDGPANADWSLAADWLPLGGPPGLADQAIVPGGSSVAVGTASAVGVLDLLAGAVLKVGAGAAFTVAGSIADAGALFVAGTMLAAGTVTLDGSGGLALIGSNEASAILASPGIAGAALVNAMVITGAGTIGGGALAITNLASGTIDAVGFVGSSGTLFVKAAGTLQNDGLLESTSAVLDLSGIIAGSGTIGAAGGGIMLDRVSISGNTLIAGSAVGSVTLDGSGVPLTLINTLSSVQFFGPRLSLTLLGSITGGGNISLFAGDQLLVGSPT